MLNPIEKAIRTDQWAKAIRLIAAKLRHDSGNHWLLTRMSMCFYEQKKYRRALAFSEKAFAIAPNCPLVLWDFAGDLDMLSRHREAITIYRRILRRGLRVLAGGECGEGYVRGKSLIADSWYRIALSLHALAKKKDAQQAMKKYLSLRRRGWQSIYSMREIRKNVQRILQRA